LFEGNGAFLHSKTFLYRAGNPQIAPFSELSEFAQWGERRGRKFSRVIPCYFVTPSSMSFLKNLEGGLFQAEFPRFSHVMGNLHDFTQFLCFGGTSQLLSLRRGFLTGE